MFKLSKLTDYGIVLLTYAAKSPEVFSARELAQRSGVPPATVSKVLHFLSAAGLLVSHRGPSGGYSLARPADRITIADVITAFEEGPIALTECTSPSEAGQCEVEKRCPVRTNWQKINDAVRLALESLTLEQMATSPAAFEENQLVKITRRERRRSP